MTWSYSGDPGGSDLDAVRFNVQDTIKDDQQVSDEEIEYLLVEQGGDVLRASSRAAEVIAAKYARQVDKTVGSLSLSAGRRQEKYERLAATIWGRTGAGASGRSGTGVPVPYAGGISEADKAAKRSDPDRVVPSFRVSLHSFDPQPDLDSNP